MNRFCIDQRSTNTIFTYVSALLGGVLTPKDCDILRQWYATVASHVTNAITFIGREAGYLWHAVRHGVIAPCPVLASLCEEVSENLDLIDDASLPYAEPIEVVDPADDTYPALLIWSRLIKGQEPLTQASYETVSVIVREPVDPSAWHCVWVWDEPEYTVEEIRSWLNDRLMHAAEYAIKQENSQHKTINVLPPRQPREVTDTPTNVDLSQIACLYMGRDGHNKLRRAVQAAEGLSKCPNGKREDLLRRLHRALVVRRLTDGTAWQIAPG